MTDQATGVRCESGWTGDRCTFVLGHVGLHSNDRGKCRHGHCVLERDHREPNHLDQRGNRFARPR